jgi:hypothetical protein
MGRRSAQRLEIDLYRDDDGDQDHDGGDQDHDGDREGDCERDLDHGADCDRAA